ncbi:hypothetical protein ABZ397_15570 [Streptomyces sp. NPDC005876]|uniref:hypothetical protein n=1 Tax=Streptomyces sp. NPDC005876 TaxID=3157076 RepID=UPI0033E4633C
MGDATTGRPGRTVPPRRPGPAGTGEATVLVLPMPDEEFVPCRRCLADTCDRAAQYIESDLRSLTLAAGGTVPPWLSAPDDPDDRIRRRWLVGHHLAFVVWRLTGRALADLARVPAAEVVDRATRLYDLYTLLLQYTGSCSAERYAMTVRADMAAWHPALSGEWHRDHAVLPGLLRNARATHSEAFLAPLTAAVGLNRHVHMAVAGRLVPTGHSLLRQAGRQAGRRPTEAEADIIDAFFRVRRTAVCHDAFAAQALRRLAQVVCDITAHGLHDLETPPRLAPRHQRYADALCASHVSPAIPRCPAARRRRSSTHPAHVHHRHSSSRSRRSAGKGL